MFFAKVAQPLLSLPRLSKRLMAAVLDSLLAALTVWLSFYLRLGHFVSPLGAPLIAIGLAVALSLPALYVAGLYRMAFRRAGAEVIPPAAFACVLYGFSFATIISAYGFDQVPRTVGLIQPILLFIAVCAQRVAVGWTLSAQLPRRSSGLRKGRMLIYGAGSSGRQLAAALSSSRESDVRGFIDDDRSLHGTRINGLPVHSSDDLRDLVEREEVSDILLALPSAPRHRRNEIIGRLRGLPAGIRTLPGLMDLAHGRVQASDLRELTIEDLLGRDPVAPEVGLIGSKIRGSVVLVTGAGGSIGGELCRQIAALAPARLLLLEISEFALYAVHRNLTDVSDVDVVPLLGSVVDEHRLEQIIGAWAPDMIFHAAAYKHVPLVEHNPVEGIRNNVIGTWRLAEVAAQMGVRDFVLVSTDKAVRPTNIMGATKRLAELILQALAAERHRTCFSMVRFGNVLGSSGSVVPLFRDQIRQGGPITITHPDITRYFMTITEAAQLVLQASAMSTGGEVFVLDMGEPVRILELARNMVELCGLTMRTAENPYGDIEVVTVGMRPGEKLFEELLIGDDPRPTGHPRIMMANEHFRPWRELRQQLAELERILASGDARGARALLCDLVVEFVPASGIVDWVDLRRGQAPGVNPVVVPADRSDEPRDRAPAGVLS